MINNSPTNNEVKRGIYLAISVLSLIALIFSIIILVQKTSYNETINTFCAVLDSQSQCEAVQKSGYGKILGIDNPWYGIFGFSILAILSLINYFSQQKIVRRIIVGACIIAGSWAIYFLYLQKYIIKSYCIFCVIVDIISIVLLILAFYITYKEYAIFENY
ncbi:MAG: vitamin K epoxide reductase family protein [Candidatus Woesearchaeota archaeon]